MSNLGTYTFKWPYPGANAVVVTGSFDNWSGSVRLDRTDEGFAKSVSLPLGQKVLYKFVVDNAWKTDDSKPSETDSQNNTNNVLPASDITPLPPATMADENQTFSVNPIPATAGLGNPIQLAPGEPVPDPSTLTSNTVASTVKLDEASYNNADADVATAAGPAGGDMMSVPPVQKGMIPESSLPMGAGPAGDGNVGPFISSVGEGSTTAQLAGQVPLEPAAQAQTLESVGEGATTAQLAGQVPLEPAAAEGKADDAAQKENAKPDPAPDAGDKRKKRRSVIIDKLKNLMHRKK